MVGERVTQRTSGEMVQSEQSSRYFLETNQDAEFKSTTSLTQNVSLFTFILF